MMDMNGLEPYASLEIFMWLTFHFRHLSVTTYTEWHAEPVHRLQKFSVFLHVLKGQLDHSCAIVSACHSD